MYQVSHFDGPDLSINQQLIKAKPLGLMVYQGPQGYVTPSWLPGAARWNRAERRARHRPLA